MTLRHLQIFVEVCNTMNMTEAANHLFMSQSAVSQAIADLESQYQVRLFERLSKKLYLTQAGETLATYARHMIRLHRDAENEMRTLKQCGKVRIGASVTICSYLLPKLAVEFQLEQPELLFEVVEDNTHKIEQLILCDKLDLGLVEGEIRSADIICEPFLEDSLVLVCGKTHPLSTYTSIEAHKLEQENFILRELGSGTRKTFEDVMQKHHLTWASSWTCNNFETIKEAVAEGLGVTVISERAVQKELTSGTLKKIELNELHFQRQFQLIYHKNKFLTHTMKAFITFCFSKALDRRYYQGQD